MKCPTTISSLLTPLQYYPGILPYLGDNDEVAKGEVAILSEVDKLENIFKASGKFGGVAGVFAGVISCNIRTK